MIIKSMSRKTPSFGQLIRYMADIDKADERFNIYRNLYSRDQAEMESEFQDNSEYATKRKNGVYLYHEVLSFTKAAKLDASQQKELMQEIAEEYAKRRAEQNLVFGTLHDDHDNHLHYHFLISANAAGESKKTRLSRAQFDRFKKDLEQRVLDHYPQLEQEVIINKQLTDSSATHSNREQEVKRRTKKPTQKELFRARLQEIFANSVDKSDFFDKLREADIEMYVRGKTIGFLDVPTGRKHRLKTLGLVEEFEAVNHTISQAEEQQSRPDGEQQNAKAERQAKSGTDNADTKEVKPEHETSEKAESAKQAKDQNIDTNEQIDQEIKRRQEKMKKYREQSGRSQDSDQAKDSDSWPLALLTYQPQPEDWKMPMPDFLAMFDAVLNTLSISKSAAEVADSDEDEKKRQAREDIDDAQEDAKSRTHTVIEQRKRKMAARRAEQSKLEDKHQHRHRQ